MNNMEGQLVEVKNIAERDRSRMFDLMAGHFDGVSGENFDKDLEEKKWAIFLRDRKSGNLKGFSTYTLLDEASIEGQKIRAIFSGDTIIDRGYWGCWELFRMFGKLSFKLHKAYEENNVRLYWFLISMGYKTYRLLPAFFNVFYPRCDKDTPAFEKKVIEHFGEAKFPRQYNKEEGVIHFAEQRDRLKEGVANITPEKLKNEHVRFFCRKNPGHKYGDELACIAEFSEKNLNKAALRMIFG